MSAQERAVRDIVIAKITELRAEMSRLSASIAALEAEARSQPLTKELDARAQADAVVGWVKSMMESAAVIGACVNVGTGFERFAMDLDMSLFNWRIGGTEYTDHGRRAWTVNPYVPAKTLKNHDDVRRVLSERSGTPDVRHVVSRDNRP